MFESQSKFLPPLHPDEDVDDGVLDETSKDEDETGSHPDVDRLNVGDLRQRFIDAVVHHRDGKDHDEDDGNPIWSWIDADPEGDPGQHHEEDAWKVSVRQKVTKFPFETECHFQARV